MPNPATVDPGALDRFIVDLVEAGFEPDASGRIWTGPLDPALAELTTATTMQIALRDGWPFLAPYVLADGLRPSVHLQGRVLCLWRTGDDSLAWLRLADLRERIAQWAERYRGRATLDDPVLDPQMYWEPHVTEPLAVVDLSAIRWGDGGSGELRAERTDGRLEIGPAGPLRVRWYGREAMRHPPVNLGMLTDGLKRGQTRNLERELERVGQAGGMDVVMLIWQTPVGEPNVLTLGLSRAADGSVHAEAYETARVDTDVLIRRAGPDAASLRGRSVILFGVGALGSQLGMLLARSGIGELRLVDGQLLRPGDIVRHAVPRWFVGRNKAISTAVAVESPAPWTVVRPHAETVWDPEVLQNALRGSDLVVDATGEPAFTEQLSRLLLQAEPRAALSAALFRGGDVARVRIYQPGGRPWHDRPADAGYPLIPPPATEDAPTWETGCAAPVNNAPPVSVASAAAFAARAAVEVLQGREAASPDLIEIYRGIGEAPFDRVGSLRFG